MALETGTYIDDLNVNNPASTDGLGQADDHMRLIKSTIKSTFPSITGAVTSTHGELNLMDGGTSRVSATLVDGDGFVVNDGGTMKQVLASSAKAYMGIPSSILGLGISDGSSGQFLKTNGSGSFSFDTPTNNYLSSVSFNTGDGVLTLNRSGLSALTVDLDGRFHQGTSSATSQDNSGNTFIQDITVDGNGHITAMSSVAVDTSVIRGFVTGGTLSGGFNTSTAIAFSTPITVQDGQTVHAWSSHEPNSLVQLFDNYQGSIQNWTSYGNPYTNNSGSAVSVYAYCSTTNSASRTVTYHIFG